MIKLSFGAAVFAGAVALAQTPTITEGPLNGASYVPVGLPNAGIAQGSIFVVKGSNLGPANIVLNPSLPLQTALQGTQVSVTVGGVSKLALMLYTLDRQVAAVLPSDTPTGDGTLTVTYNSRASAAVPIRVVPTSFGMFTRNQGGSGPAIVQNYVSPASQPVNAFDAPASAQQIMILWGTGLGRIQGNDAEAPPVGDLPVSVEVLVGGVPATILYKGRAPGFPGTDQINFQIPAGVPQGCYVPLVVRAGGVSSNFGTLAIAGSGSSACADTRGLTQAELERARLNNALSMGTIALSRVRLKISAGEFSLDIKQDSASASFFRYDYAQLLASSGALALQTEGACVVFNFKGESASTEDPQLLVGLDAGPVVNLTGPRGVQAMNAVANAKGVYSAQLSQGVPLPGSDTGFLEPGPYTAANGAGGVDVGGFVTPILNVPAAINWANMDAIINVPRAQALPVTWSGASAGQTVTITGVSTVGEGQAAVGAGFVCTAPGADRQFSVPATILSLLPPSQTVEGIPTGFLMVGSTATQPAHFTARGLDIGVMTYSDVSMKNVAFQ